jgi:hypothetical protein
MKIGHVRTYEMNISYAILTKALQEILAKRLARFALTRWLAIGLSLHLTKVIEEFKS